MQCKQNIPSDFDYMRAEVTFKEYTVVAGDSLYEIANKYQTTVSALIDINMLTSNTIYPGQILLVPVKKTEKEAYTLKEYETKKGDTIESIALKEKVDPVVLGLYNDFGKLKLESGQKMLLPLPKSYVIKKDDTVKTILKNTNMRAEDLLIATKDSWLVSGKKLEF